MEKSLSELSESFRKGLLSRRDFVRRVVLLTGGTAAAGQVLTTLGFDADLIQEAEARHKDSKIEETTGQYSSGDEMVDFFLAKPVGEGPYPAMIVIHENMDITEFIRNVARKFARQGFVALAPSVLRFEQRMAAQQSGTKHTAWMLASLETGITAVDMNEIDALNSGFEYLLTRGDTDPEHIGSVGFCWGGARSFTLATANERLWAAIVFYGSTPPVEALERIKAPVLGLYATLDLRITERVPETAREMLRLGKTFEWEVYNRARHGFFRAPDLSVSKERPAKLAWRLVEDFLERHYQRS